MSSYMWVRGLKGKTVYGGRVRKTIFTHGYCIKGKQIFWFSRKYTHTHVYRWAHSFCLKTAADFSVNCQERGSVTLLLYARRVHKSLQVYSGCFLSISRVRIQYIYIHGKSIPQNFSTVHCLPVLVLIRENL